MIDTDHFTVRIADQADAQAIAQFNINIARETEGVDLLPEVILAGVKNLMNHSERGFYLVVVASGKETTETVAASLMVTTEWSDWRNGTFWWIQSVYVDAAWRRHGLYRMMYEKVQSLANAQDNVCGFRLYVEYENEIAQKTYEAMGMVRTHYHMFEQLQPGLIYQKT